jgi:hypothetical protein
VPRIRERNVDSIIRAVFKGGPAYDCSMAARTRWGFEPGRKNHLALHAHDLFQRVHDFY